jgi:transaldolase
VIASSLSEICEQARKISSWGSNVYVKIPIINEYGESTSNIVKELIQEKIKVNVTAVFTEDQVRSLLDAGLNNNDDCVISVFCGRILDTGIYPNTTIKNIDDMLTHSFGTRGNIKILWAGVRSGIDIHLAKEYCDIITLPSSVIDKMSLRGKNLDDYTLDTVKMFANDSKNFNLD